MVLTSEEAQNIVYGDTSEWLEIEKNVVDTSRWSTYYEGIFKHIESGKYYEFNWTQGSTEMQDESPFEYEDEVIPTEVEQVEVLVKQWVGVKKVEK